MRFRVYPDGRHVPLLPNLSWEIARDGELVRVCLRCERRTITLERRGVPVHYVWNEAVEELCTHDANAC